MGKGIGRNDPCPCGSGKKYKKCCMAKDQELQRTVMQDDREFSDYDDNSFPNLEKELHPHVVARFIDQESLNRYLGKKYKRRLNKIWTISKVAALSTEEIVNRLTSMGVDWSPQSFIELTKNYSSGWDMSEVWLEEIDRLLDGPENDFLGLAACELWKRLAPERPSFEMIDDLMQEGYQLSEEGNSTAACDRWLDTWKLLCGLISQEITVIGKAEALFPGTQSVLNWMQDFSTELLNASLEDLGYADLGLEYLKQLLAQFTDEQWSYMITFREDLATLYFRKGDEKKGERLFRELITERPDHSVGYACLAMEIARQNAPGNRSDNLDKAIALLEQAFAVPVIDAEDWDLELRLEDLRRGKKELP